MQYQNKNLTHIFNVLFKTSIIFVKQLKTQNGMKCLDSSITYFLYSQNANCGII